MCNCLSVCLLYIGRWVRGSNLEREPTFPTTRKEIQGKLSGNEGDIGTTLGFCTMLWVLETVGHEEAQCILQSTRQTVVLSPF